ncbi:MAG: MBL fold metallo-hydrolase [Gemmatimonadales bacterium]
MARTVFLDDDIVPLRLAAPDAHGKRPLIATLLWGDRVTLVRTTAAGPVVRLPRREWNDATRSYDEKVYECLLPPRARFRDAPVLKVRFFDVGQGDGSMIETPGGQIVLIDGGEESHVRRYLTSSFSHVLHQRPLDLAAIVVTHGDADHFAGLTDLARARRSRGSTAPMIRTERIFHNGIVKGPNADLGTTTKVGRRKYLTELHDDLRSLPDARLNQPFRDWRAAATALRKKKGGKPAMRRLVIGDDAQFGFLADEDLAIQVLGPIPETVRGREALPWLQDASHTINGHSIVLKATYGNVRFLFGADLNTPAEERLLERARTDGLSLTAEVLKAPHHGSADFSPRMLEAVRPVVSVVSSGDESGSKEYIHPRAGLVGALGRYSRGTVDKPLVYVTEMVAFFARKKGSFRDYTKTSFGIVHIRTDGRRVLVATNSGRADQKEAYAFVVDERGDVTFEPDVRPLR